jgi:hypothetical protein
MLVLIAIENGVKKIIPLTADAGAGNPVGTVIVVCSNQIPSNYLPLGTQYDTSLYPVLYALLGTDTTPTASALGLPTLTSGQYAIKATSGLSENAQDNVINTLNEQRSYSTEEVNTGKKWIDGKPIYRRVLGYTLSTDEESYSFTVDQNIQSLISVQGILSNYGTNIDFPIPYTYRDLSAGKDYQVYCFCQGINIVIIPQSTDGHYYKANSVVRVIVEYTKTV